MRLDVLVIATVVVAPTCSSGSRASQPAPAGQEEALRCAALEAAVDSLVPRGPGQRLALNDSTTPVRQSKVAPYYWSTLASTPGVDSTTWLSFVSQNQTARQTCAALPSGAPMVVVSDSVRLELARDHPVDYWRAYYARFSEARGLTSVSGIGLSEDGTQALLTLSHVCGGLCAQSHVVLLERTRAGRWSVRLARLTMVS